MSFIAMNSKESSANEYAYLTNKNGIVVSNVMYEKLIKVGYSEREILNLKLEEMQFVDEMNVERVNEEEFFIKTTVLEHTDGTVEKIDEELSKEDTYSQLTNELNSDMNSNENIGISTMKEDSHFTPTIDLGGGGGISSNPTAYASVDTEYKHLTVTGTYYKDKGNLGTFFVKTTVDWLKEPKNRLNDLITINFSDNVQITSEYISGSQCPAFVGKFFYNENYKEYDDDNYSASEYTTKVYDKVEEINGSTIGKSAYYIDHGLVAKFNLPNNSSTRFERDGSNYLGYYNYTDFSMTLSANFVPKQTGLNATSFAGTYEHQLTNCSFDWGDIGLSPVPPYVSWSTHFIDIEKTYDTILAKQIFFDNLAA